jgi:hypothetical protein
MPRAAHRKVKFLARAVCHAEAHRKGTSRRVLCFECYRARIDRPEHVKVLASPFPRALTDRELTHRRRMLAHLKGGTLRERCDIPGRLAGT